MIEELEYELIVIKACESLVQVLNEPDLNDHPFTVIKNLYFIVNNEKIEFELKYFECSSWLSDFPGYKQHVAYNREIIYSEYHRYLPEVKTLTNNDVRPFVEWIVKYECKNLPENIKNFISDNEIKYGFSIKKETMLKELINEFNQIIFDGIKNRLKELKKEYKDDQIKQYDSEYRHYTVFSVKFKEYNYSFLLSNNDGVTLTFNPTVAGSPSIKLNNHKFETLPDVLKELNPVHILPLSEFIIRYEYADDGNHEELLNYVIDDEINRCLIKLNRLTND